MTRVLGGIDDGQALVSEASRPALLVRWVEFVIVFVGAPLPFVMGWVSLRLLMPLLLLAGVFSLVYLLLDKGFERRRLWHWRGLFAQLPRVMGLFVIGAALIAGLLAVLIGLREAGWISMHERVQWLALPRQRPEVWMVVMIAYPIVSVYPQELIYRAFMFRRYELILPSPRAQVLASALVFGWVHVVFATPDPTTWLPVGLCVLGGVLFGWSYEKGRSLAAAWFEHAIYGCFVFTIGMGWLFYGGSVREAAAAVGN